MLVFPCSDCHGLVATRVATPGSTEFRIRLLRDRNLKAQSRSCDAWALGLWRGDGFKPQLRCVAKIDSWFYHGERLLWHDQGLTL